MKEVCKIQYEWWGGQFVDRMWVAIEPNGDALDYGSLEHCKKVCVQEGYDYEVVRHHRDGSTSILETSI